MGRRRTSTLMLGAAIGAIAVVRHRRGHTETGSPPVEGGILVGNAGAYDRVTRLVFGTFTAGVAADVSAVAPDGARVLDVGCGPGHLSLDLARRHGLDVTGIDLDPAMIARADANADADDAGPRPGHPGDGPRPTFMVGDVASLAFPDQSFDVVVSTLSMHHWADPTAGLAEIGRVLRPHGRALVWDLRPGAVPIHRSLPDPIEHTRGTTLRPVEATPWRWPWRFALTQRIELARDDA